MLNSLHRHVAIGGRQSASETERLVKLAKILTYGVAAVAGTYFALLYLIVGR